jgi:hypothetical protein
VLTHIVWKKGLSGWSVYWKQTLDRRSLISFETFQINKGVVYRMGEVELEIRIAIPDHRRLWESTDFTITKVRIII